MGQTQRVSHKSSKRPSRSSSHTLARFRPEYQIVGKLGVGGMGRVYLAIMEGPLKTKQQVVLKLPLSLRDAVKWRRDFENEARVMAQLNHPNIVRALEWTELNGLPCMVSEYIEGFELFEIIHYFRARRRRVPFHIVANLMLQTCEAVNYIHTAKTVDNTPLDIVHRDIDASNIMLSTNGYVKVIDFGVAKHAMQEEMTKPGVYKGKMINFPPDIFLSEKLDHRADIFALGILLFELLTGQRPRHFTASDSITDIVDTIKTAQIPKPSELSPGVPEAYDRIVARATALNRNERYSSAVEMFNDLQALSDQFVSGPNHMYIENWVKEELGPLLERRSRRLQALQISGSQDDLFPKTPRARVQSVNREWKKFSGLKNHVAAMKLRLRHWKSRLLRLQIPSFVPLMIFLGAVTIFTADNIIPPSSAPTLSTGEAATTIELIRVVTSAGEAQRPSSASQPRQLVTTMLPAVQLDVDARQRTTTGGL